MGILEQVQADFARALREALDAQTKYKAAVAKYKAAQLRLERLEITKMEQDLIEHTERERAVC